MSAKIKFVSIKETAFRKAHRHLIEKREAFSFYLNQGQIVIRAKFKFCLTFEVLVKVTFLA